MREAICADCGNPYQHIPGAGPYKGRCIPCRIKIGGRKVAQRLTGGQLSCNAPEPAMDTFVKQPAEVFDVELDMTKFAPDVTPMPAVTVVSVTSVKRIKDATTGDEVDGADSTTDIIGGPPTHDAPAVIADTARVVWWLKGGTAGDRHKITVKITFASGQTREADVGLEVRAV